MNDPIQEVRAVAAEMAKDGAYPYWHARLTAACDALDGERKKLAPPMVPNDVENVASDPAPVGLLPCPFCGGPCKKSGYGLRGCTTCNIFMLTETWNTRAEPAPMTPEERAFLDAARRYCDERHVSGRAPDSGALNDLMSGMLYRYDQMELARTKAAHCPDCGEPHTERPCPYRPKAAQERYCVRSQCGHAESIHTPECHGEHVRDLEAQNDAPCQCPGFVAPKAAQGEGRTPKPQGGGT